MHQNDQYLNFTQAAKRVPGRPHVSTLWRWANKGVRAADGNRIFLEAWRFGGKHFTTLAALEEFGRRLNEANRSHFSQQSDDGPTPAQRRHEQDDAKRKLSEAGILE